MFRGDTADHHSLSGEWHASYPAIRRIVGCFFIPTGDQHLFSWGAFWGLQKLECLMWCIAQFHKLQILAVTTWIPEPDYWTNYPYRCNVPYVLVLSCRSKTTLPMCRVIGWMVCCSLSNWWFHLVATWAETLWTTSRRHACTRFLTRSKKSIDSPHALSWHVLFEADSSIEFYHSLVRWEISSRLIYPKKGWAVQCPVEGELWKVCQGEFVFTLGSWRGAKIEGLPWIYCEPWSTNTGDFAGLRNVDQCMLYRGLLLMPMDRSNATNAIISGTFVGVDRSTGLIGCVCRQSLGCITIGLFYHQFPYCLTNVQLEDLDGWELTAILSTTGVFCKLHRRSLTLIVRGNLLSRHPDRKFKLFRCEDW